VSVAPSLAGRSLVLSSVRLPFLSMSGLCLLNKLLINVAVVRFPFREMNLNTIKTTTGDQIRNQAPVAMSLSVRQQEHHSLHFIMTLIQTCKGPECNQELHSARFY